MSFPTAKKSSSSPPRQENSCTAATPSAEGVQQIISSSAIPSSQPWPEDDTSSLSSIWTYSYMNRIFKKGALQKHDKSVDAQLTQQDLYRTPKNDEAALLNAKFWTLYKETNYNFRRTLWLLVKPVFMPAGICQLVALAAQLSVPMCVMKLLQEIERKTDPSDNIIRGTIGYVLAIFFLSIINALCTHRYQFLAYESGIIIRSALTCAIYQKSLDLSPKGRMGLTSGNVTNLVATDTQKLFEVMHDGHQIWSCPLAIVVVVVLLLLVVGPPCLVGAAILIGLVPLSKRVAHWIVRIRKQRVAVADERIEIVSAMLQDIKITKLMNYEDEFERRVQDARRREMALVRKEQFVWGLTLVIRVFTPVLASFATFVTYVLVSQDNIMTASVVFTLTMLFNMLKFPINQAGQLLSKAALGVQAIHRISRFMGRESKEHGISERQQISAEGDDKEDVVLEVKDGSFHLGGGASIPSADRVDSEVTNATASFTLSGINFRLNRGEVLAVVGPVASGKSTLIQGLLGDVQSSDETSIAMASGSNVSYAAQTPFILSTTVRENITFGSPFDRDRYDRVLDACCLRPDLKQWPAGDLTEIGERGVTMSGGQKQRVSVARAVYANVDVVLFDDILSALDAGTSQKLFDNLFDNVHDTTSLLHNCGIVLVTHSRHILQRVDKILVLDKGESIFCGSWTDLQLFESDNARHKATLRSMKSSLQLVALDDDAATTGEDKPQITKEKQPEFTQDEDARKGEIKEAERREHGVSSLAIWLLWFKYAGGIIFITVQITLMGLDRGSYVAIDFWLAIWTTSAGQAISVFGITFPNQYETQNPYVLVYTILVAFMVCFLIMRSLWAVSGGVRASTRVFSTMTNRVLHAPMSYFDTTPMGRILNRFTYDVEQVDITLAQYMSIFLIASSWLVASQVVIVTIVPWLFIVSSFVLFLYVLVLRHYRWSASDLQRLDAVSRSPLQAALAEGLDGSFTIRAYGQNGFFTDAFQKFINDNSSAMMNFVASRRWLAVRLEVMGAFVTLSASFCITMFNIGLTAGLSGLLLVWSSSMTTILGFLIQAFGEAEAAITSIERMHSLEMLPQEKSMITSEECRVDKSWPKKGELVFDNVSLRYRPGLPLSLDGLSFTIKHGQRVAVVGRTGAGKSTLTTALFRLVEVEEGMISLDDVDLSILGLSDVRGRRNGMFILPQDPAVFSGTIRSNLDPFLVHSDEELIRALELVKFPHKLLNEAVEEGGGNFSAGEKQLLCLARAMLANPRLLVLDEATSSCDRETDSSVQQMLRSEFPDTTLLTIAHRLDTIIDYDVVIVMENGRVAEMGSPRDLLSSSGIFTDMVNATGPESAAQLKLLVN